MTAFARFPTEERGQRRRALRAGVITIITLVALTVGVFLRHLPFASRYTLRADFSSTAQLAKGSEVRIAGLRVGRVQSIARGPHHTSIATLAIDDAGRPIHTDATFTIKPRLLLEGNAYVDVSPGTPDAAELASGAVVPLDQTATSVQLDQVLDIADLPSRDALHSTIAELRSALGRGRQHARASRGDSGDSGAAGLRRAVRALDGALLSVTRVARAARGARPGDLASAVRSTADVTDQLARDPRALADLIASYDAVAGALAAESPSLAATVRELDDVLRAAPAPLAAIDAALPSLTTFAGALRPALQTAPPALRKSSRLLDEVAALLRPRLLPALVDRLGPALTALPALERRLRLMLAYSTPVTDCISTHVLPTLRMKVEDGPLTTGDPAYLDLVHLFAGLTGVASAVDGNGGTLRLGITGGDRVVNDLLPGVGRVVGRLPHVDGVRPTWLGFGVNPPFRPDQPCAAQPLPDLSARSGPPPSWARRAHG